MGYNPEINSLRHISGPRHDIVDQYSKSIISFSHIMGSITSILVNYVRSAFSDDYIKTIWNALEVPYAQRSKAFMDIMTKPKPCMIIDPKFDPSDEPMFVPQSEFDSEIANDPVADIKIGLWNASVLTGVGNFALCYKPRRYKMSFNLHFSFQTDIQRIQCQEYIRQSIRHRVPIVMYRYIENIIPDAYMKSIAKMNGFDYRSDEFLDFINHFTTSPISRRLRTGSGNLEFFAMMRSPIQIWFHEGPSSNGPIKKGNIVVSSSFSEFATVEFTAMAVLFLKTSAKVGDPIFPKEIEIPKNEDPDTVTVVGTDSFLVGETPEVPYINEESVKIQQITVQADKQGDDTLSVFDLLRNPEIAEMLAYYRHNKKKMDFLHVAIYEGANILDNSRYTFDKRTLDLKILNMDVYVTYHIIVYMDKSKFTEIKQHIFETDKFDHVE